MALILLLKSVNRYAIYRKTSTQNVFYTDSTMHRNSTNNLSELDGTDWIPTNESCRICPTDFIGIR